MTGLRLRASSVLTLLAVCALCFGAQLAQVVSGKDQAPGSGETAVESSAAAVEAEGKDAKSSNGKAKATSKTSKKKARTEKRKKKGADEDDSSNRGTPSGQSGTASGGGTIGGAAAGSGAGANQNTANGNDDARQAKGQAARGSKSPKPGSSGTKGKAPKGAGGGAKPSAAPPEKGPNPDLVKKVMDIQDRHTKDLISQKGIVGTATGLDDDGNVVIKVYTTGADSPKIPKTLENVPVVEVLTGTWRPYFQAPTFDPKLRQPRPVPIGVSGINTRDVCGNVIAAGTIGCRVKPKDGSPGVYALSNNHVFADENAGVPGDPIVQPGSLDAFNAGIPICATADIVGTLFKFKPIDLSGGPNVIDAAIMKTDPGLVSNSTPSIAYGKPRSAIFNRPYLGLRVQKMGRTTSYTTGTITGLNQTVLVAYTAGIGMFVNQIEITPDTDPFFANPGDSGSLIVSMDRFPVALLFAGAGILVNGNPIEAVLDEFGMVVDGDDSDFVPPGKEGRSSPNSP